MTYSHSTFRNQMQREMHTADDLYVRANQLRLHGRDSEADALELRAERIDSRHANTTYSTWLNQQ